MSARTVGRLSAHKGLLNSGVLAGDGVDACTLCGDGFRLTAANAARLVACWNEFDGIADPAGWMDRVALKVIRERDEARAQRDALVEALRACVSDLEATYDALKVNGGAVVSIGQFRRLDAARDALASVEGGT